MMSESDPKHPKNAIGEMCTCGHPMINHCASGHYLSDGSMVAVSGHGGCLACEDVYLQAVEEGKEANEDDICSKFTFKDWIFKGDENYEKFKELFEEE